MYSYESALPAVFWQAENGLIIFNYHPFSALRTVASVIYLAHVHQTMNKLSYALIALVAFTLVAPALAVAESENEENEGAESGEREGHEGSAVNSGVSNMVLYITLATIAGVGGISAVTVYKARRKSSAKKLV